MSATLVLKRQGSAFSVGQAIGLRGECRISRSEGADSRRENGTAGHPRAAFECQRPTGPGWSWFMHSAARTGRCVRSRGHGRPSRGLRLPRIDRDDQAQQRHGQCDRPE